MQVGNIKLELRDETKQLIEELIDSLAKVQGVEIVTKSDKTVKLLEKILYELITTDNLYACDNPEGKHLFEIHHTELIRELSELIQQSKEPKPIKISETEKNQNQNLYLFLLDSENKVYQIRNTGETQRSKININVDDGLCWIPAKDIYESIERYKKEVLKS